MTRVSLLASLIVVLVHAPAHANRIVSIVIQVDGKPHLEGGAADNGGASKEIVWRYLSFRELSPSQGVRITTDVNDPLKATLRGKIAIEVTYGGKAEVSELHLVRRTPDAGWTVADEDVERIAKEIGLGVIPMPEIPPPASPAPMPPAAAAMNMPMTLIVAAGAVAVLIALIGVVLLWSRRA
jgi:hypothetical protein